MSIISEIDKLNNAVKVILMNVIFTAPFFYIDLFFMGNYIFTKSPFYVPIVISVCMSFCWYYSTTIIIIMFDKDSKYEKSGQTSDTIDFKNITYTAISVISLSVISAFSIYFDLRFRDFFHVCFVTIVLCLLATFFLHRQEKKANAK